MRALISLRRRQRWRKRHDQVCPAPLTQRFVAAMPDGTIVLLPKVGHGYSVERNWLPQYEAAFDRLRRKDIGQGR
jgi:hypothetical protein